MGVPQKIISQLVWQCEMRKHKEEKEKNKNVDLEMEIDSVSSAKLSPMNKMRKALQDETQFELFVQWMFREINHEIVLCFIELLQFKRFVLEKKPMYAVD